ncbi:uncharacterized protein [Ptychodera flava]|uniref:uncharacterized protein n=1 Tax=Ptychodera flava TaxID=63121 RepID=UPI00396A4A33
MATCDLTPSQCQQGWRKCYSARVEKPYYFNIKTNESRWSMPGVPEGFDGPAASTPGNHSPTLPEPAQEPPSTPLLFDSQSTDVTDSQPQLYSQVHSRPITSDVNTQTEFTPPPIPNDLDRKVARKLVKYIYAKFISQEVDKLVSENCEGCQHDYLSQREHECLHYGCTPAGQREVISKYFGAAAERIDMSAVERSVQEVAEICNLQMDFGLIDLDELLHLLCYRWADDPEGCFEALMDNITVYGMVLCNDIIESMCATNGSSSC